MAPGRLLSPHRALDGPQSDLPTVYSAEAQTDSVFIIHKKSDLDPWLTGDARVNSRWSDAVRQGSPCVCESPPVSGHALRPRVRKTLVTSGERPQAQGRGRGVAPRRDASQAERVSRPCPGPPRLARSREVHADGARTHEGAHADRRPGRAGGGWPCGGRQGPGAGPDALPESFALGPDSRADWRPRPQQATHVRTQPGPAVGAPWLLREARRWRGHSEQGVTRPRLTLSPASVPSAPRGRDRPLCSQVTSTGCAVGTADTGPASPLRAPAWAPWGAEQHPGRHNH